MTMKLRRKAFFCQWSKNRGKAVPNVWITASHLNGKQTTSGKCYAELHQPRPTWDLTCYFMLLCWKHSLTDSTDRVVNNLVFSGQHFKKSKLKWGTTNFLAFNEDFLVTPVATVTHESLLLWYRSKVFGGLSLVLFSATFATSSSPRVSWSSSNPHSPLPEWCG